MLDLVPAKKFVVALLKASELEYKKFPRSNTYRKSSRSSEMEPFNSLEPSVEKKIMCSRYMGFSFSMGRTHHWG
jgi:hypothetical protein